MWKAILAILVVLGVVLGAFVFLRGNSFQPQPMDAMAAPAALEAKAPPIAPPPAALSLVRTYSRRPTMADLEQYGREDVDELIALLAEAGPLDQKRGVVWALAFHGDERVVRAFENELHSVEPDQVLTRPEEDTLLDMVLTMGFLADEQSSAYSMLERGVDPAYWTGVRKWQSERGEFSTDLLVEYSLQGLGISGRPEAQKLLSDELKSRDPNYLHRFAGGITQAAFYGDLRAKNGEKGLCGYMLAPGDKQAFMDWISAGEGKIWFDWANGVMSGPQPPPLS